MYKLGSESYPIVQVCVKLWRQIWLIESFHPKKKFPKKLLMEKSVNSVDWILFGHSTQFHNVEVHTESKPKIIQVNFEICF